MEDTKLQHWKSLRRLPRKRSVVIIDRKRQANKTKCRKVVIIRYL